MLFLKVKETGIVVVWILNITNEWTDDPGK